MELNTENKMVKILYEQPSIKKYGTMKELTLGGSGSGSDGFSQIPNNQNNQRPNQNDLGSFNPQTGERRGDRTLFDQAANNNGPLD